MEQKVITTPTTGKIDQGTLRRFSRLEDMSDQELEVLANRVHLVHANKRAVLIPLGDEEDNTFYLVDGKVRLEAADGKIKDISHDDTAAKHPISRLRPSRYKVTALSKVKLLKIENDLLDSVFSIELPSKLMDQYEVSELLENDSDLSANYLLQIYKDLSQGAPIVPSWHKVSVNVVGAIIKEKQDKRRIVRNLMLDPVLAAKILHQSLLEAGSQQETRTCRDAVAHLDMGKIQKLAFMALFEESIDPDTPVLLDACRVWWEKSIRVSAVTRILAMRSERFDPEYLALGGLLHAIGEAVIIGYAHRFPEFIESGELQEFLSASAGEVGRVLLTLWGFPHQFVAITADSADWYRDSSTEADGVDIVLVARAMVGNAMSLSKIPEAETLPAYRKLGLLGSSAATISELNHAAKFASDEAIKVLAGLNR